MADFTSLTSVGLVFDVVGVIGLGAAFFLKSPESLSVESGNFFGGNNATLKSRAASQCDGVFGTSMLVIGFVLQLCGVNGIQSSGGAQILYVVLILFTLFYVGFARTSFVEDRVKKAKAKATRVKD
jgi:hypothetical protein